MTDSGGLLIFVQYINVSASVKVSGAENRIARKRSIKNWTDRSLTEEPTDLFIDWGKDRTKVFDRLLNTDSHQTFLNPLDTSHVKSHSKGLERGSETWKMIGQTFIFVYHIQAEARARGSQLVQGVTSATHDGRTTSCYSLR